jgi:formate-dependent nitrite reductase cytochrome c552 subunit
VTNRKLYDYFERWTSSVHKQEDVTCVDCHGGNPEVSDKDAAHAGDLGGAPSSSAINFRNIPRTCGDCHDDIYEGFRKSSHFEHVVAKKQEDQGPTCVTCHGSINVSVLNVTTVEETCTRCHNEESDNHPENATEARALLNRFLSIHRYYRYITVRGDPVETREFFEKIDAQIHDLSVTWHTFDLSKIREETRSVLDSLKHKRQEVATIFKERRRKR